MLGKTALFIFMLATAQAAELKSPDELELKRPVAEKKRIVAHYMPASMFYAGCRVPDNCNPAYAWRNGAAANVGGLVQAIPMSGILRPDVSLTEAAEHEIRAATLAGIDGFQFFYPYSGPRLLERYNEVIAAFYRVAEAKFPDFRLTLCLCCGECRLAEAEAIERWSRSIRALLAECRASPAWLKTPDGRYLIYTWCPDGLAGTIDAHYKTFRQPNLIADTAAAYRRLSAACGIRTAIIYHLRKHENAAVLKAALDHFPAVWGWTDSFAPDDGWVEVAKECRRRGRTYTQTVYPDYYTSKLYDLDTHKMIHRLGDVLDTPMHKLGRESQNCGVTYVYRNLLERAVEVDSPLINVATWNDFAEGHHLAPEVNHNFAFQVLLKHYKRRWLGLPAEGEWAAVFYKKYPSDAVPNPFAFNVLEKRSCGESEDVIELVTHLKSPAELELGGQLLGRVARGLKVARVPIRTGAVELGVKRGGKTVLSVVGDEWITDKPYRTDRLTYGKSSRFGFYFERLYGGVEPPVSNEYNQDTRNTVENEVMLK